MLPKGEMAKGLKFSLKQKEYLKVFLTDGEVPIDDSASEWALRNLTIGRKNWITVNAGRGDIQLYGDGARRRPECLLLPQASADGTVAAAVGLRRAEGICARAAYAVVKSAARRKEPQKMVCYPSSTQRKNINFVLPGLCRAIFMYNSLTPKADIFNLDVLYYFFLL